LAGINLSKEIENYLNTFSPLDPQALGDYLKALFEDNQIYLSENDFFEKTQYPYLDFAKILKKFFEIKDKIILDSFYGKKIDFHEHYRPAVI
jgi:hypothetical protein